MNEFCIETLPIIVCVVMLGLIMDIIKPIGEMAVYFIAMLIAPISGRPYDPNKEKTPSTWKARRIWKRILTPHKNEISFSCRGRDADVRVTFMHTIGVKETLTLSFSIDSYRGENDYTIREIGGVDEGKRFESWRAFDDYLKNIIAHPLLAKPPNLKS